MISYHPVGGCKEEKSSSNRFTSRHFATCSCFLNWWQVRWKLYCFLSYRICSWKCLISCMLSLPRFLGFRILFAAFLATIIDRGWFPTSRSIASSISINSFRPLCMWLRICFRNWRYLFWRFSDQCIHRWWVVEAPSSILKPLIHLQNNNKQQ